MNCERSVIASAIFITLGLGLIFGYCHGTIGFSAAYPVSGTSLQVSVTTTGLPALAGSVSTVIGVLLLVVALIQAVVRQGTWPSGSPKTAVPAK
jgi:uncharacterized membrane protein